jgi:hypothetical protein
MPITQEVVTQRDDSATPATETDQRRPGLVTAGLTLTYIAAGAIGWTGIRLAGFPLGDIILLLAGGALLAADLRRPLPKLPPWVWIFALCVLVIGTINQFAPPSVAYMTSRNELFDNYIVIHTATLPSSNFAVMIPFVGRIVALPLIFSLAYSYDRRALVRAALAFVAAAAFSSLIAFTDSRGITSIGPSLTGVPVEADHRASGLTATPNVVAMSSVLGLPFVLWRLPTSRGRERMLVVIAFLGLLLGLYASRSRSGAGAAGLEGLIAVTWLPQYRRFLPTIGLLFGAVAAVLFAVNPGLGTSLLKGLRVVGADTSGSDAARSVVNDQGLRDFLHSPIHGIGLEVAEEAHIVYLQALAVGGLILLSGLLVYLGGALWRCARLSKVEPLAIPLFVALLGGAIFNAAQNALTPSVAYLMEGLAAALPLTRLLSRTEEPRA